MTFWLVAFFIILKPFTNAKEAGIIVYFIVDFISFRNIDWAV